MILSIELICHVQVYCIFFFFIFFFSFSFFSKLGEGFTECNFNLAVLISIDEGGEQPSPEGKSQQKSILLFQCHFSIEMRNEETDQNVS